MAVGLEVGWLCGLFCAADFPSLKSCHVKALLLDLFLSFFRPLFVCLESGSV